MNSNILEGLNEEQRRAVEHLDGALLILAGAGSGKTKTLTTRLAYLINEIGIPPSATLTLTFTNKAALEMRYRALNLIQNNKLVPPLLCTFHKFGLLFLKLHIHYLGRRANFILLDSDDRKRIFKTFDSKLPLSLVSGEISKMKNLLITSLEAQDNAKDNKDEEIARIYATYEKYLLEKNMLDFDDLLLLSYRILNQNKEVCESISSKYAYIMVDEYQDTNELQCKLLKKLTLMHNNICVVGDDDQSIYSWRGAKIENILDFEKDFNASAVIRLEKNYRSTSEILSIANKLISHNVNRLGKELQSIIGNGKEVEVLETENERLEAATIASRIRILLDKGIREDKIAVLFRVNALSRSIEESFNKERIPYKIIGAMRFYERAEVKDILSYFRLIVNFNDDFSFLRILNRPKRGIGKATQDRLEQFVSQKQISIYQAISDYRDEIPLSSKYISIIADIFATLSDLREALEDSTIGFLDLFKEKINILDTFKNTQDDIDREANVDEFYGFFRDYIIQNPTASLEDFLNDISLMSDTDTDIEHCVSCMSVHSSKGLEFEYLFVIGLEEGFLPIISDNTNIEEERRLGYVAFTRAKSELVLSYVKTRLYKGRRTMLSPSRFLRECGIMQKDVNLQDDIDIFRVNDLVFHKVFGAGRIIDISSSGREVKLKINFGGTIRDILSSFVAKA